MFEFIKPLATVLEPDIWIIVSLGIIGLVFIAGLVLALFVGGLHTFCSNAKAFLKNPSAKTAKETVLKMPVKVKKAYKRAVTTGSKPSDIINFDVCVGAPYHTSVASKMTKAIVFTTLLVIPLLNALLNIAAIEIVDMEAFLALQMSMLYGSVLISVVGLVLAFISGLVSWLIYSRASNTYYKYVDKLDEVVKGGGLKGESTEAGNDSQSAGADFSYVRDNEPVAAVVEDAPMYSEPEPVNSNSFASQSNFGNTFESSTRLKIETVEEDDEPSFAMPAAEPVIEDDARAQAAKKNSELDIIAEEIRREKEEEDKRKRLEQARAAALERARAAQSATQPPVMSRPAFTPVEPVPSTPAGNSEADAVIGRIEKITAEGAPLATMKEVALQLQKERAKPTNTPEQQKKLNEALSMLLKAMSSAAKK